MKFLLALCCLYITAVSCIDRSKEFEKHPTLQLFANDKDLQIPEDEGKTGVVFTGDVQKSKTISHDSLNQGKGRFKYSIETQNGIKIAQSGKLKDAKTFVVMGSYSFIGAGGKKYRTRYTADELGYHPITELDTDDVLPILPPIKYKIIPTTQRSVPIKSLPYKQPEQQSDVNQYLPPKTPTYLPPKNNDFPIATQKPYRPLVTNPPIYLPPKVPFITRDYSFVTQKPYKPVTFKPIYLPPITTHRPIVRTTQRIVPTTQRAYLPPNGYLPPN